MWRKIGRIYKNVCHFFLIFFWWTIWQIVFFFLWWLAFGSILFFLKNGCPFSAPPRAYFYHPQLPKNNLGESWNQTAFTQKKLRSFDQNWRNTRHICTRWIDSPNPGLLGLNYKIFVMIIHVKSVVLWSWWNYYDLLPRIKSFIHEIIWILKNLVQQ